MLYTRTKKLHLSRNIRMLFLFFLLLYIDPNEEMIPSLWIQMPCSSGFDKGNV